MRLPSRLKTILLASAVVVVSFAVSLKALDWLSPRAPVRTPALVELPPLAPASRSSTILAPVVISLSAIRDAADRAAPRNFAGKSENPVSQVLQNADIGWTASRGPITATGNPLDVALKTPNAMFAVQNADSTISYTRDGSFSLNSNHELVTQSGALVLDSNKNPITLPPGQISIASNGTVSVTNGKSTTSAGTLGVFTGSFSKAGANLYTGSNVTDVATPDLAAGSVEGSNVNAVESMLDLIRISRSYEMQQKSITQQDELSQKLLTTIG